MRSRSGKKEEVLSVLAYASWDVKYQLSYLLTYALSAVTREMRPGVILIVCVVVKTYCYLLSETCLVTSYGSGWRVCVVVTNLLLSIVGDLSHNQLWQWLESLCGGYKPIATYCR